MMKGQAFSTFKLMIAAVVAVAILGILLSIIGRIGPVTGFNDEAKSLLRDASSNPGITKVSSGKVPLKSGEVYPENAFTQATGAYKVEYKCVSGQICSISNGALNIEEDADRKIYACCESGGPCRIGIGTQVTC